MLRSRGDGDRERGERGEANERAGGKGGGRSDCSRSGSSGRGRRVSKVAPVTLKQVLRRDAQKKAASCGETASKKSEACAKIVRFAREKGRQNRVRARPRVTLGALCRVRGGRHVQAERTKVAATAGGYRGTRCRGCSGRFGEMLRGGARGGQRGGCGGCAGSRTDDTGAAVPLDACAETGIVGIGPGGFVEQRGFAGALEFRIGVEAAARRCRAAV